MRDYIDIGCVPPEEQCEQLGPNYRPAVARDQCRRFIELLRVVFGTEPDGARLSIKRNQHDFGEYLDVVCHYDSDLPESTAYAMACEAYTPGQWTDNTPVDWRKEYADFIADHKAALNNPSCVSCGASLSAGHCPNCDRPI